MAEKDSPILVWFRLDLRLDDNPALCRAVESGKPVVPVFIWSPEDDGNWPPGGASRWWLHHSLASLAGSLPQRGSRLIFRVGSAAGILDDLVRETGASAVYWNRRYEPDLVNRDARIKKMLRGQNVEVMSHNGNLLFEPHATRNKAGGPFKVFSPFWKHCSQREVGDPFTIGDRRIPSPAKWPGSVRLEDLSLLPTVDWAAEFPAWWTPGESEARRRLDDFLSGPVGDYSEERNYPARDGVSRLSPHLHFGEIGPRRLFAGAQGKLKRARSGSGRAGISKFLAEVGWREFAHHLLYHYPDTSENPLRPEFSRFPWRRDRASLTAWRKGETGYPIVDAGMRQLWRTGWMHNRVRMIAGSFLVKDLLLPWREGARWFWDTLVDADLASNTLGWQWVAGCGADAAPYFRVFNPVLQGKKFDVDGDYIRQWIPELKELPGKWIHCPWDAPKDVLDAAGILPGKTYPTPIIDHHEARLRALRAFETIKKL